jgi:ABC-type branched-subunit amino acid transport system permease subunit
MSGENLDDALTQPLEGAAEAAAAEGPTSPEVGRDEWVARHGDNLAMRGGPLGKLEARLGTVPWWAWLTLFVSLFALVPVGVTDGYWRRVAFDTVLFMMLALGLNVVVGWGGLLDLGYVLFYGFGAYTYAILQSDQLDLHWPTLLVIAIAVAGGALLGILVGLPSKRLSGDYLAIVTLFAYQIFISILINGDNIFGTDLTGGVNGILKVDPMSFFGHSFPVSAEGGVFNISYLYIALAFFTVLYVALRLIDRSRTGRAWRSLREDPLAAQLMGMPVPWLKLMAFSFGAAIAALTGTLLAALNGSVFPGNFDLTLLITIYAMMILGGLGSQAGAVLGAVLISVLLELLREPANSRYIFYLALLLGLIAVFRFSVRLAVVAGGLVLFGVAIRLVVHQVDASWTAAAPEGSGWLGDLIARWVVEPAAVTPWVKSVTYISLIALALLLTTLKGWVRLIVLVPTIYLAVFVWENVLAADPAVTRYILLGGLLVVVMIVRPNGLLGEKRVEII